MIKINLLSPFDKLDTKWEKINRSLIASSAKVIVVQLFFIILLVASIEYLKIEKYRVNDELKGIELKKETREIREIETNIKNYENWSKYLAQIRGNHIYWTKALYTFVGLVPEGVKINSFKVNKDEGKLKKKAAKIKSADGVSGASNDKFIAEVTGDAKTRTDLLKFENNLKNSEFFTGLISDNSNYVKPINISFKYTFYIDKKHLMSD